MIGGKRYESCRKFSGFSCLSESQRGFACDLELSKSFPKEETYSLTDQIRRAVRSVGAQIAEAWAKRRYEKHFVSKLRTPMPSRWKLSIGSAKPLTVTILIPSEPSLLAELQQVGRMLNSMMEKSHLFCRQTKT